jgi:uncharacterized protein
MDYRELPRGGGKVSTIGLGAGSYQNASDREIEGMLAYAMDQGVNLMDTVMFEDSTAAPVARALKGKRDKMVMQIHIGAIYPDGVYTRTRAMSKVMRGFELELEKYGTDYADIGLIHYVDDDDDFEGIMAPGGIFEYARRLKESGAIRYLGFSSHSPAICRRFIDTGAIDVFMFSVNPTYDFEPKAGKIALSSERQELYRECQKLGIGITVMKSFGGGQLLSAKGSPFHAAMTIPQCLHYALDRPGVLSCLPGVGSMEDVKAILGYYDSSTGERDYSFIGELTSKETQGSCIYCNHCQPCPVGIDIGSVNKFFDLAKAGDHLARDHYKRLGKHASDCAKCGACETNCPFRVAIRSRLEEAAIFFGQ